jgi:hypothetical protein
LAVDRESDAMRRRAKRTEDAIKKPPIEQRMMLAETQSGLMGHESCSHKHQSNNQGHGKPYALVVQNSKVPL